MREMMGMGESLKLNGHSLHLNDIVNVARHGQKVELDDSAIAFVERGSEMVSSWVREGKSIYGVTTGFGDLASTAIPPEKSEELQENLLKSHACGVGEPFSEDVTRAIMLLRVNTLIRGFSGISLKTLKLLVDYLNLGIHPVIPEQGSVGASGDLCPLSHLGISLLGLGDVVYEGKRMPASEALSKVHLKPIRLGPKEGLALNNGTTVMTAVASLVLYDALELAPLADVAAALSLEALKGVPYAFDPRTHELRPHEGQQIVARNILNLIDSSEIIEKYKHDRVQDAYSLRCVPQVHGASRDALDYVKNKIQIEINSVTDNPLIFPAEGEAISGGNFHGQPIALAMDFLGIALSEIGNISERRIARLVDHKLSGLPPFLISESGVNSGFMIPQYVAAALVSENKGLSHPASVDSIPTSANQEDHVSMGMYAARKASNILKNVRNILAIEFLTASQGLDFLKPLKAGKGTGKVHQAIREVVPFIQKDEYLHPLIGETARLVSDGTLLRVAKEAVSDLQ
jgi:histidine ammonia-lyase